MDDPGTIAKAFRADAILMAGRTRDLAQRAAMYHHLFDDSGGNHGFPLLAAHGALWASSYFRQGLRFAKAAATFQGLIGREQKADLVERVERFAESFREINRQVCVETLYIYWLTGDPRCRAVAEAQVPVRLLSEMDRTHWARATGRRLNESERRAVFEAFFRWEQAEIVGPVVDAAFAAFDWRLINTMARRPTIRFAYFGLVGLRFADFSDRDERIEKGLAAFALAEKFGWKCVERSLADYRLMPAMFFHDPSGFVATHRSRLHDAAMAGI